MNLPEEFIIRMQKRLGAAYPAFLRCYDAPPVRGVRANLLKLSAEAFAALAPFAGERVPWAEGGFYTAAEKVGHFPAWHAGLFYAQEPSAMCAAPLLAVKPGERVLDLCAAPGGKTTQLAAAMRGEGVLVANEYVFDRARILSQNVERLGVRNAAVVSADPAALAARLPQYFDKILVDAPCSGEGMFRRDETAIAEWSVQNVERCIVRQREILDGAAQMLAGGGALVYSTCTFERGENEDQVAQFLVRHPDFVLIEQHLLLPHAVRGEGHFAAVLQRTDGERCDAPPFPQTRNAAAERAFAAFAEEFFVRIPAGRLTAAGDRLYLLPAGLPALAGNVLRAGLELGTFDAKRFTPAHALAMAVSADEVRSRFELSDAECVRWLRGETLSREGRGWGIVAWRGHSLGLCKAVGGVLKNHYPKGLRDSRVVLG